MEPEAEGSGGEEPRTDRLFFALFPDSPTAARIAGVAEQLRAKHGLLGWPLQSHRLHVAVNLLDDPWSLPEWVAPAALEAGARVEGAPFDVTFDRAASLRGPHGKNPLVLCGDGLNGVTALHRELAAAMTRVGVGRYVEKLFLPHMTLLHDETFVAEEPVEPIGWTARELVLVHSVLGQTQHIPLGRWRLG